MVRHAALAAAAAAFFLALPGAAAQGAAIAVTTNTDVVASDGFCSLREAVQAANTDAAVSGCPAGSGADQISLAGTTYTLMGGQLTVSSALTITGAGAGSTTIDGHHDGRVLNVPAAGDLTLRSIGITHGLTANGTQGNNGGDGGGILNAGTLTIDSSRVFANATGIGGHGGDVTGTPDGTGDSGRRGGDGGGVYSTGTLTITDSTIDGNATGSGGPGGSGFGGAPSGTADGGLGAGGGGGKGGSGGGVFAIGTTSISGSTISGNTTGRGGFGGDGHGHDGSAGGGDGGEGLGGTGGAGGDGAGLALGLTAHVLDDSITGNTAGDGGSGGQGFGGTAQNGANASGDGFGGHGGKGGNGGGVWAATVGGSLDFARSLLAGNHSGNGSDGGTGWNGPGAFAHGGDGGSGGDGGGLLSGMPTTSTVNVTFAGNSTGNGGVRGTGPPLSDPSTRGNGGGGGNGSAARVINGTLSLQQVTISGNADGAGGTGVTPGAQGAGSLSKDPAGAVKITLANSIADGRCGSGVGDGGGNLATAAATGCPGTPGDPKLGQLQDNGGPTKTMAIGTNGAAIDAVAPGPSGCAATTDQRGAFRPSGSACDIGAFEVALPIATTGSATAAAGLTGTLDPRGLRTRWYFEYGKTPSYGSATADQFASGGSAPVSATPIGLAPNTTYHYRLVAVGPDGTSTGGDRTFTTPKLGPKITGLKLKPKKFRVSGKKPLGTKITYRDTFAAITTFTVLKPARGVKVKGKCLRPTKKRHGKRCTRYVAVGRFTHIDHAGLNRFRWGGKAGGHKLRRGSYRLRAVPVAGVLAGKAVTTSFRVVK